MKHKSPDYKLSAVNYYLNHDVGYDNTCKIFDCKKSSLKRWIFTEVRKFPINKIICLDETSVGSALKPTYSRCNLGKRCIIKTSNQFVFRKFSLLVAISNTKCVGKELYEKGGMTKERLLEFLEKHIFPYKDHLIILDNAGSHNNELIKNAITKSAILNLQGCKMQRSS